MSHWKAGWGGGVTYLVDQGLTNGLVVSFQQIAGIGAVDPAPLNVKADDGRGIAAMELYGASQGGSGERSGQRQQPEAEHRQWQGGGKREEGGGRREKEER